MNTALIKAVRDHALANYNKSGWDIVVECWSDEDISAKISGAKTPRGAINKVAETVNLLGEQRSEVRAAGEW